MASHLPPRLACLCCPAVHFYSTYTLATSPGLHTARGNVFHGLSAEAGSSRGLWLLCVRHSARPWVCKSGCLPSRDMGFGLGSESLRRDQWPVPQGRFGVQVWGAGPGGHSAPCTGWWASGAEFSLLRHSHPAFWEGKGLLSSVHNSGQSRFRRIVGSVRSAPEGACQPTQTSRSQLRRDKSACTGPWVHGGRAAGHPQGQR